MPHRVASFFRATSSSLVSSVHDQIPKPPSVTLPIPSSTSRGSGPSRTDSSRSSLSTQSSSSGNIVVAPAVTGPVKMAAPGPQKEHSLKNWWHRSGRRASHSKPQCATLDWTIESPPAILYGPPDESTGALVSGQLILNVKVDQLAFSEIKGFLNVHVVQKRPFQNHCDDCANQHTEVKSWNFMPRPLAPLPKGEHTFPFSVLLGGHLPATTDSVLCSIKYEFNFYATTTTPGEKITLHHELPVSRTLTENETPHHSIRVFPPTNIAASAHFPTIIHPGKSNTLQLHLNGLSRIINPNSQGNRQVETWKLKRINWRLDEKMKTVAPACEKHSPPAQPGQTTKKGALRTETRVIGAAELSSGWKSDYTPTDSQVEMELEYKALLPKGRGHPSPLCDLRAQDGTEITHNLVVELVVVQEIAPLSRPSQVQATGTARILRMHFNTIVTKEANGGVSWDNECPPLYNEVPPSPPSYPEAAPSYSISSLDSDDPELANAVLALRQEVAARGGIDGLPDAVSTGNTSGRNEVLEGRGSTEGLVNDN